MKTYRIKDEKFRKPAQKIAGFAEGGRLPLEHFISNKNGFMRKKLEEYGVFDLWFEEEPEFKSGDYIYTTNTKEVYQIEDCEVIGDELHWNIVGECRGPWDYNYCAYLSNIRHATAEEIKEYNRTKYKAGDYIVAVIEGKKDEVRKVEKCEVRGDMLFWSEYGDVGEGFAHTWELSKIRHATAEEIEEYKKQLPIINGYKGKRIFDYIVYGCKSIHVQDFRRMYEACLCMDLVVDSITIEGQEVPMETLQEIYEKTY